MGNGTRRIDANDWRYVLYRFPDSTYDVTVCVPDFEQLPYGTMKDAVEIVLDGEIGEERRILLLKEIEIVESFDGEHASKSSPISVISHHLDQDGAKWES